MINKKEKLRIRDSYISTGVPSYLISRLSKKDENLEKRLTEGDFLAWNNLIQEIVRVPEKPGVWAGVNEIVYDRVLAVSYVEAWIKEPDKPRYCVYIYIGRDDRPTWYFPIKGNPVFPYAECPLADSPEAVELVKRELGVEMDWPTICSVLDPVYDICRRDFVTGIVVM